MQNQNRPGGGLAVIAILGVTAAWGASFVLMKGAIERQPIADFLATRFALASLVLFLIRPNIFRKITKRNWWTGSIAGLILALGYITQTIGLHFATPAITGFYTGLYVVATPLIAWLLFRQKLSWKILVAVGLALFGLGIISLSSFGLGFGEWMLIVCSVLFALHIIALGRWSPGSDPYALTLVQLLAVTVVTSFATIFDGSGYVSPPDGEVWLAIIITALFATAVGFLVQTWAQAHLDPARAAILLTTEVPWTAFISVASGHETLTLRTLLGGSVMFLAMVLVEWPTKRKPKPGEISPAHPIGHFE